MRRDVRSVTRVGIVSVEKRTLDSIYSVRYTLCTMSTLQQLPTITSLRKKIYPIVDQVIKTGVPATFTKDDYILEIRVKKKQSKLANLKTRNAIIGDPDELVNLRVWEWHEQENLK